MSELVITAAQREQIRAAYLLGIRDDAKSCCCSDGSLAFCAAIVGEDWAATLRSYFYEELGCSHSEAQQTYYLAKIDKLTTLHKTDADAGRVAQEIGEAKCPRGFFCIHEVPCHR